MLWNKKRLVAGACQPSPMYQLHHKRDTFENKRNDQTTDTALCTARQDRHAAPPPNKTRQIETARQKRHAGMRRMPTERETQALRPPGSVENAPRKKTTGRDANRAKQDFRWQSHPYPPTIIALRAVADRHSTTPGFGIAVFSLHHRPAFRQILTGRQSHFSSFSPTFLAP